MTATKRLKAQMQLKGYTQTDCAKILGISYQAYNNKLNNKSQFKVDEIVALCKFLGIPKSKLNDYFFCTAISQNG